MGRGKRRTFGTTFQRGSTFFVQYLDAQGRRVKERAGGTRALADRLLAKRREEVETSRVTGERPLHPLGFRELVDRWEAVARGTRREGSLIRDLGSLRAGPVQHFGETLVHAIRASDVEAYLAKRQAEDSIAPGTRNNELTRLSVLFAFAVRVGAARQNPAAAVPRARVETPEVPYLEPADRERLLAACPEPLRHLAAFLLESGLRLGEALRLSPADLDLAGRRLTVRTSKAGRPRVVGLTSRAVAALEAVRPVEGAPVPLTIFGALGTVDYRGEAVLRTPVAEAWRAARKRAGFPDLRLHDLRHVAASTMVRAGVALSDVAAVLGHGSLQMVAQRYGRHVPASAPVLAADRMERFLNPAPQRAPVARAE